VPEASTLNLANAQTEQCGQWVMIESLSVKAGPGETLTASLTGYFSESSTQTTGYFGLCYQFTDSKSTVVVQPFSDSAYQWPAPATGNAAQKYFTFAYPLGTAGTTYSEAINVSGSVQIPSVDAAGNSIASQGMTVGFCAYNQMLPTGGCGLPFGYKGIGTAGTVLGYVQVTN
jgi:hypothetical protein